MNPATASIIVSILNFVFQLWRDHAGKPADWKPTAEDIDNLINEVKGSTPEARKEAARERLGLPTDVVERDTPQAPVS